MKKKVPLEKRKTEQKPGRTDRVIRLFLRILWALVRYGFFFFLGALFMLCVIVLSGFVLYTRIVATSAGTDIRELTMSLLDSRLHTPTQTDGRKNILILGTDILGNRDTDTVRTDTMMIASVGIEKGDIKLISFPRDLWIASQSTKINALYEREQIEGRSLLPAIIGDISGVPIHHTLIIDSTTVGEIVDAFGGVDIDVTHSFVDTQFPRTDVDVRTVHDPKKLYETVAFSQGKEHMSGDRILQYIRSRHSTDPSEGSDDARVRRQQQVIATVLTKLKDLHILQQPEVIGRLYKLYRDHFQNSLPLIEMESTAWQMAEHHVAPSISAYQFPIEGLSDNPVLEHPTYFPSGAWVYVPIDPSWNKVRDTVQYWLQQ